MLEQNANLPRTLKGWLRLGIVITATPPLLSVYQAGYQALMHLTCLILRRDPAVRAVYVRKSCARGTVLPGISDIDFAVVVDDLRARDDLTYHELPCNRAYQALRRIVPLLEPALNCYCRETLQTDVEIIDRIQSNLRDYHARDGDWKLLWGEDTLAKIELPAGQAVNRGTYLDLNTFWRVLLNYLLLAPNFTDDPLLLKSVCCRALGEIVRAGLSLQTNRLPTTREESLARMAALAAPAERAFLTQLQALQQQRYLSPAPHLPAQTIEYALTYLNRLLEFFPDSALFQQEQQLSVTVDGPVSEFALSASAREHVELLVEHAQREWGGQLLGAALTHSVLLPPDMVVVTLAVSPDHLPSYKQLRALVARHVAESNRRERRILLYLLLPHGAILLGQELLRRNVCAIASPSIAVDFFTLAYHPEHRLCGLITPPSNRPHLAAPTLEVPRQLRMQRLWHLERAAQRNTPNRGVIHSFWDALRLTLLQRSLAAGRGEYAVTLPAVERALEKLNLPLPEALAQHRAGFYTRPEASECGTPALAMEAVRFLQQVEAA